MEPAPSVVFATPEEKAHIQVMCCAGLVLQSSFCSLCPEVEMALLGDQALTL